MIDSLIKKYIGSTVRAALNAGVGYLVTAGMIDQSLAAPFVDSTANVLLAVAVGAGTLAWSWAEKKAKTVFLSGK